MNLKQKFCLSMLKLHVSGLAAKIEFLTAMLPQMPTEEDALSDSSRVYRNVFHAEAARGDIAGQLETLKTQCAELTEALDEIDLDSPVAPPESLLDEIMQRYEELDAGLERASDWAENARRALVKAHVELN